ncbi:hypothetical protein [Synechocystis salina]|uniref:Uncharacterized protein n=1 Tax=Synechocystis salina LEGE 00031 TaxID=1828736 RepID=A0ABR9VN81_9SYNC|nr:hypothetical protein [Synechocystis salina]MBE9241173.1 hypothetical protein [Synechocystis salina LEGE 00041]MBE9252807.1 hypothetical protein [Synechocystis salina LEGE 00031]
MAISTESMHILQPNNPKRLCAFAIVHGDRQQHWGRQIAEKIVAQIS